MVFDTTSLHADSGGKEGDVSISRLAKPFENSHRKACRPRDPIGKKFPHVNRLDGRIGRDIRPTRREKDGSKDQ